MNEISTALAPHSGAAALIPRTMRDAMELANMMARTGFLPREIQTPGGALFVMEQAMRWNMSPFAVATEVSFIQGKPMFSGKIVAAAVQSSGILAGRLSYDYSGSGDGRTVVVSGTLRGETEPRTVTVRLADARTPNKVWNTQPDQQLAYHGSRVWARRHAPEVMLGVYAPEEMEEAPAEPREVVSTVVETPAKAAEPMLPVLAPDASLVHLPAGRWLAGVGKALAKLEDADAVRAWREAMGPHLATVAETDDLRAMEADRMIAERLAELGSPREPGEGE